MFSSKEILTNIDNDIERNLIKNNVTMNNVNTKVFNNDNVDKNKKVEIIANDLVDKLNSPNSYKLFCKVAYKNSESIISRCLALTLEANNVFNKGGYFISLIKTYGDL